MINNVFVLRYNYSLGTLTNILSKEKKDDKTEMYVAKIRQILLCEDILMSEKENEFISEFLRKRDLCGYVEIIKYEGYSKGLSFQMWPPKINLKKLDPKKIDYSQKWFIKSANTYDTLHTIIHNKKTSGDWVYRGDTNWNFDCYQSIDNQLSKLSWLERETNELKKNAELNGVDIEINLITELLTPFSEKIKKFCIHQYPYTYSFMGKDQGYTDMLRLSYYDIDKEEKNE